MTRIAVVDDSATIRRFVVILLDGRYDTVEYDLGATAIAGIVDSPPDLVLLDIELPDTSGPEVLRALRDSATANDVPVVALTGHADDDAEQRFLALGFDAYLTKPVVDEAVFYGTIERLLDSDRTP